MLSVLVDGVFAHINIFLILMLVKKEFDSEVYYPPGI